MSRVSARAGKKSRKNPRRNGHHLRRAPEKENKGLRARVGLAERNRRAKP